MLSRSRMKYVFVMFFTFFNFFLLFLKLVLNINSHLRLWFLLPFLLKTFPQLFTHKKQSQSIQITTKYPTETSNIDDFKFIHMFRSRQSSLYFEVSDGSKHYLEKRSTQKNHLDLFRKNSEPKMKSYRYAMYFSVEKSAFLRDVG